MKTLQLQMLITLSDDTEKLLAELFAKAMMQTVNPVSLQPVIAGKNSPSDQSLLIDKKTVAKLLSVCEKTIDRMSDERRLPSPIRMGGAIRWSSSAIKKWVDDGGPELKTTPTN